jgi:hypothetical protein
MARGDAAQGALGRIVVEAEAAVLEEQLPGQGTGGETGHRWEASYEDIGRLLHEQFTAQHE